jgi:hypothetical protein
MRTMFFGVAVAVGLGACSSGSGGGFSSAGTGHAVPPGADNGVAAGSGSSGSGGGTSSGGAGGFIGGSGGGASSGAGGLAPPAPAGGGAGGLALGGTSGGVGAPASSTGGGSDSGVALPAPGVLTAGVWDDSLNYPFFSGYLPLHAQLAGNPGFTQADYDASHAEFAQRAPHTVVDAALVIDTTGSMADELSYLTAEFASISGAISARFPNADQRWALVVYRDTPASDPGDAYVVQHFDFTGDMQAFARTVGAQTAANGGDTPESPELGLDELSKLSWRTGPSVAKLAFWVADAPHHDYRAAQMKAAIEGVHQSGVHIYPVSGSGTDDLLELTMRTAAEITGGRYLFLTNDSGVGGPHKAPEIPCYYVTLLEKALVRVASMELSGSYIGPDAADVIRVSGNPSTAGTCDVGDDAGTTVQIF